VLFNHHAHYIVQDATLKLLDKTVNSGREDGTELMRGSGGEVVTSPETTHWPPLTASAASVTN
jgi:hypothetical protein